MRPAVKSAFDIAFWFADTALNENEYLQPQKLHRLMFLAQAYYAVAYEGRVLMPGFFVADDMGPLEPNIYAAYSKGRPDIDAELFLPEEVEGFLQNIWRRFGHFSADKLTRLTKETKAFKLAHKMGPGTEITVEAMRLSITRADETPGVDQVIKPKVLRTQTGKPVTVQSWKPRAVDPQRVSKAGNPNAAQAGKAAGGKPVVRAWRPPTYTGDEPAPPPKKIQPAPWQGEAPPPAPPEDEGLEDLTPKERIKARQAKKKAIEEHEEELRQERAKAMREWAPRVIKQVRGDE